MRISCDKWLLRQLIVVSTLISWILSIITIASCDFYNINYFSNDFDGLGIFKAQDGSGGCADYKSLAIERDAGVNAGRFFGVVSNLGITVSVLLVLIVMYVLPDEGQRQDCWKAVRVSYIVSSCLVLMTFAFAASRIVKERCGETRHQCSMGPGGAATVINLFLLSFLSWTSTRLPAPEELLSDANSYFSRLQPKERDWVFRWILLGMVLLCSILAVVAVVSCEFYEADYFSASYDGFGIFKGGDSRGKCASYAETGLTVDSGVRAARFFGVVSCMILSASSLILLPLAMFVLQNGNRREALWHGTKIGLTLSLCSVLMTFSFSASDNVTERCGTRSCSLGVGGGASVANVVLLVGSLALSFSLPSPDSVFRMSRWRSARPASSRRTRLAAYAARILYHQTDEASANAIRSSGKMLRGASGSLGAAIYFTESERGTQTKAKRKGYMVKARVRLGKVKDLKNSTDPSLTFQSLLHEGFDSVSTGYFSSGKEYAVYSYDQVEILNIEKL